MHHPSSGLKLPRLGLGSMLGLETSLVSMPIGIVRSLVSGSKVRFTAGGYDLDLTYITDRIIAMGLPAESIEAAWRNSLSEVARFLHEKHPQRHRVYNLCDERDYEPEHFYSALHLPFPDHHPPSMDTLLLFVADAKSWLLEDAQNVVAVHCKAGKGRTGVMIAALLLALGHPGCESASAAIRLFRARRTRDGDAVRNAGQVRYVHYYADVLAGRAAISPRSLRLVRLELRLRREPEAERARQGSTGALVRALRGTLDAANGGEGPSQLGSAGGATVQLRLQWAGLPPVTLEPDWQPRRREAPAGAGPGAQAQAQPSHVLAQIGAWLGEGAAPVEAGLAGVRVSGDALLQLVASSALGRQRLWRLNFHCGLERLHTDDEEEEEAAPAGAPPPPRHEPLQPQPPPPPRHEPQQSPPPPPQPEPAGASLELTLLGAALPEAASAADAAAGAPGAEEGPLEAQPAQALAGAGAGSSELGRGGGEAQLPGQQQPAEPRSAEPQPEGKPGDTEPQPRRPLAPAGPAGGPARRAERYLRFERDGLDDCRGFASLHDFELRIYVQEEA